MRYAAFASLLLLAGAACSTTDSSQNNGAAVTTDSVATAAEPLDTTRARSVTAQSDTLKVVRARHVFSAPGTPDQFTAVLRGTSVLSGEVSVTITDAAGQVIFREMLSPGDLEASMVYEMKTATATQAEREAFVRRRLNTFFAEANFRQPAVGPQATYAPGELDRPTWDDLRQRPDAVSFQYLVGKEDRKRIAWSPLKKQVVHLPGFGG
ncbi:hypothetical protein [Hymenobacter chitinivorans]|uniref:Lipoprotein n=1 Tax=Hymenobacter chitinivorans DSM 11115 TaxID=1121954 RepID=A0A2M9BAQ1_9BACT|nr:hypothetical protein [Hymenobacter chitinivorans]PJJ55015.1 hypothetical protein CLV45_3364 [Hymenobacter chitinivorans DSM 11115]